MRRARQGAFVVAVVAALATGCGGSGAEGTYVHDVEGTITLSDDGSGSWAQEGHSADFEWEEDGETVTFLIDGEAQGEARLEDGDLVLPPDMISGDDDVTFERQ